MKKLDKTNYTHTDKYLEALVKRKDVSDEVKLRAGLTRVVDTADDNRVYWLTPKMEHWCREYVRAKLLGFQKGSQRRCALIAGYGADIEDEEKRNNNADRASKRNRKHQGCFIYCQDIVLEMREQVYSHV